MRYRGSPAPCKLRFTFAEDAAELETRQEKSPAIAAGRRTVKQSRSPAMMSPTAVSYGRRPRVFVTERFDRRRGELEQTRPQEAVQRTAFTLARQQQPAEDDERRRARNAAEARRAGEQERPHAAKPVWRAVAPTWPFCCAVLLSLQNAARSTQRCAKPPVCVAARNPGYDGARFSTADQRWWCPSFARWPVAQAVTNRGRRGAQIRLASSPTCRPTLASSYAADWGESGKSLNTGEMRVGKMLRK